MVVAVGVIRRCAGGVALLAMALAQVSCETTVEQANTTRPMPADPVPAPPVPAGARPNSMAFLLLGPKPRDTDANGRADLITVEAYLFAEPFPTPFYADGTFIFDLYPMGESNLRDAVPTRTWTLEPQRAAAGRSRALAGACYRFQLSLFENGGDRLPFVAGDLTARFEPADGGAPVRAIGVRTVQLGGEG